MEFAVIGIGMLMGFLAIMIDETESHGRLMNPPARNAMWRAGYPNPVNYNDNELFCGGYIVQQSLNKGKCGVCGDEYRHPKPRPHEMGGIFGNGVIVRRYYAGQDITVQVDITSNHKGYFIFRICPATSDKEEVTQACLNKNQLKVINSDGSISRKYKIRSESRSDSFNIRVRLPPNLTCERCVLQWWYVTGNTWGPCPDGSYQLGCGPQENFVNCADVSITDKPRKGFLYHLHPELTSSLRANPYMLWYKDYTKIEAPLTPLILTYQVCIATWEYKHLPGMDDWCQRGCMRYPPYCPAEMCRCVEDCGAVGEFSLARGSDQWCLDECSVYPPRNCSEERCQCW